MKDVTDIAALVLKGSETRSKNEKLSQDKRMKCKHECQTVQTVFLVKFNLHRKVAIPTYHRPRVINLVPEMVLVEANSLLQRLR